MLNIPILSFLIFIPLIGVLAHLVIGKDSPATRVKHQIVGIGCSTINFIVSLFLLKLFDYNNSSYQLFEFLGCSNNSPILGIDGISLSLILLTTFLMPICYLSSYSIKTRYRLFSCCFLLLESIIIGIFSVQDLLTFYILFESSLIPMFIIIGVWGGDNRVYAAFKFFLYTLAGSLLFLIGIIYLYVKFKTFDIIMLTSFAKNLDADTQKLLWLAFFASFCIKIPMFPFHTWLPDAHVQAPTAGSVILAGVLLKLGGYGFIRFSLPMFPIASSEYAGFVALLSVIAIIYGSFVAFAQTDMKKMIAYSSVAHMGYVTIGIFANNAIGINGAMFQMISHGIVSAALFLVVGSLYDRVHTKEIAKFGGIVTLMPILASFFMVFMLSSVGLPGTSGFVGEFLVIVGSFQYFKLFGMLVATGVIFGAVYMLYLYAKTMFGEIHNYELKAIPDLSIREIVIFLPLALLTFYFGIYPSAVTDIFKANINNLIR